MKRLIVLGMALALMLSVAPAMAGDFGALKDIATAPAMTDTELDSVEGGIILIGNVAIGAQAGVINNISDGKVVLGSPAIDANQGRRAYGMIQYLPEMRQSIRSLQMQIEQLLSGDKDKSDGDNGP